RGGDAQRFYEPDAAALHGAVGGRPAAAAAARVAVRLRRVRSAAFFRERIVWRASEVEYGFYEERRWNDLPAHYVERALVAQLGETPGLRLTDDPRAAALYVDVVAFEEVLDPVLAAVVRLAAPTTLVMAVAAVSNVVYTYFVSRLGMEAIGAVSLVFPVSLLAITAMAGGIGAGASSAVARALGAGRRGEAAALAGQALVLSVVIGLGFGLVVQVAAPALFRAMGARGAVHASATLFARVLFGGAALTFLGGMFDSVLRGEGNVR